MKADASDSGKPRTWTLRGYSHIHLSGSALGRGEVVEVMPVADHEKAMAEMREETEFLRRAVYRAEQAWATAEDELARLREAATDVIRAVERWLAETAPGMHINTMMGRTATRTAVAALARAALVASPASSDARPLTRPPASFWREVPCGHPADPVAWVGANALPICHCGQILDGSALEISDLPDGIEVVIPCSGCGCAVGIPTSSEETQ